MSAPVTALVLPVREAETIVRARALAAGSPYQPQDGGVMAHVTLLFPFATEDRLTPELLDDLTDYFAMITPFGVQLTAIAEFPDGTAYLTPEPASTLATMIDELAAMFPAYPPYEGRFDTVVPHVTTGLFADESAAQLAETLAARLPIDAEIDRAVLWRVAEHDLRTLETFEFSDLIA